MFHFIQSKKYFYITFRFDLTMTDSEEETMQNTHSSNKDQSKRIANMVLNQNLDSTELEETEEDPKNFQGNEESQSQEQNNENADNKEEESVEETYDVEKILSHRVRYKKLQFYLKWDGWSEADNSWEDFEYLNCPEKINEYRDKVLSESNFDVLSLLSTTQRDAFREMFKDYQSVIDGVKFRPSKNALKAANKVKGERKKKTPKDKSKKKDKNKEKPQKKVSKIPKFEVISPDFQTSNPLYKIESVYVKDGEIFYQVKRRKLPPEEISSELLRKTYPEALISFLNEHFTGK